MEDLIKSHRILICAGSGGVGKTTVSAALAVAAAQMGLRTLVLTIDPAKRLASALGLSELSTEDVRVPHQNYPGELFAGVIDAEKAFAEFIRKSSAESEKTQRILNNPLFRQLSTELSGSQEFTSVDRLYSAVKSGRYDLVILDTPPAQHAIDFLRAPEKIYTLFQSSITRWFIAAPSGKSLLQKLVSRGTQTVLNAFEKVTGSEFVAQLADFFKAVQGIQDKISQRSIDVHRMLLDPQCAFVLVTGFDEAKLSEAHDFYLELQKGGYNMKAIIVNRAFPTWSMEPDLVAASHLDPDQSRLMDLYLKLKNYYDRREKAFAEFQNQISDRVSPVRLPDFSSDIVGLGPLEEMAAEILNRLNASGGAQ